MIPLPLLRSLVSSGGHPPCLFFVILFFLLLVYWITVVRLFSQLFLCDCMLGGVILAEWVVGAGVGKGNAGLGTVKGGSLAPPGPLPVASWEKYPQQRLVGVYDFYAWLRERWNCACVCKRKVRGDRKLVWGRDLSDDGVQLNAMRGWRGLAWS